MTIGRAQIEEQIKGFNAGGASVADNMTGNMTDEQLLQSLQMLQQALNPQPTSSIEVPDFQERFGQYQQQLGNIMGQRQRSNIFDLASSVGRSMLAADPTKGAFASLGAGLADFNEEERARREAAKQEDRAVAMKAFELAQSDVKSAQDLLNQYELAKAKQNQANDITFYTVQDPNGITLGNRLYKQGEQIPLNQTEALSVRDKIGQAGSGGISIPTSGAGATYMSREDAEATIESLGLSRASENFDRAVEQITAKTPDEIGAPVIVSGGFGELRPVEQNDVVNNIILAPSASAGTTGYQQYRDKRVDNIAKEAGRYNDAAVSVIPQVDFALNILLDKDTKTGAVTELTANLKRLFVDAFGSIDQGIQNLDSLEAIANSLGPKMRPSGSGSTSDREFAAYKQALLSIGNTKMANYLSLYRFLKITENGIKLNNLELEALADDRINTIQGFKTAVADFDTGVWEKWTGDPNNQNAVNAWVESLPRGAVIFNRDKNGNELFPGESVYIIKGWEE